MEIVNAEKARVNLYQFISDVNSNGEPITIVNSRGEKQFCCRKMIGMQCRKLYTLIPFLKC